MTYDPERHHRRSIRLRGYDYAQAGAYFVTICIQGRACLLGDIVGDAMQMNEAGRMIQDAWCALPARFPDIELDEFMVMPTHFHGIIVITGAITGIAPTSAPHVGAGLVPAPNGAPIVSSVGAGLVPAPNAAPARGDAPATRATTRVAPTPSRPTLGEIVGAFKSVTTHEYVMGVRSHGWMPFPGKLWQRNYYEHIIRSELELDAIRAYIAMNPLRWALDAENPLRWALDAENPLVHRLTVSEGTWQQ